MNLECLEHFIAIEDCAISWKMYNEGMEKLTLREWVGQKDASPSNKFGEVIYRLDTVVSLKPLAVPETIELLPYHKDSQNCMSGM